MLLIFSIVLNVVLNNDNKGYLFSRHAFVFPPLAFAVKDVEAFAEVSFPPRAADQLSASELSSFKQKRAALSDTQ